MPPRQFSWEEVFHLAQLLQTLGPSLRVFGWTLLDGQHILLAELTLPSGVSWC